MRNPMLLTLSLLLLPPTAGTRGAARAAEPGPAGDRREVLQRCLADLSGHERDARAKAVQELRRLGPDAAPVVPDLVAILTNTRDPDFERRQAASRALAAIGAPAVPALVGALRHEDRMARASAIGPLGDIGPAAKAAVPALIDALRDKEGNVCSGAAQALGAIGPDARAAIPALVEALKDNSNYVLEASSRALGEIGPDAVPALIDATRYRKVSARQAAIQALNWMGPEASAAVPALREALLDDDWRVRNEAAKALGRIGPAARVAVPDLVKFLTDQPYPADRVFIISVLRRIKPDAAAVVPALVCSLKDPDRKLACEAAGLLATYGPAAQEAVPALTDLVRGPDVSAQYAAVAALKAIGPGARAARPVLREQLQNGLTQAGMRVLLAGALGRIGPEDHEAIQSALLDLLKPDPSNPGVRISAAATLGELGIDREKAVGVLTEAVKQQYDPHRLRQAAAVALRHCGPEARSAVPALRQQLAAKPHGFDALVQGERLALAVTLARLSPADADEAVAVLVEIMRRPAEDNPEAPTYDSGWSQTLYEEATAALGELGPVARPAVPVLLERAHHRKREVRRLAAAALAQIDPAAGMRAAADSPRPAAVAGAGEDAPEGVGQYWPAAAGAAALLSLLAGGGYLIMKRWTCC